MRYARAPSFWLDEAFVAVSLRNPSLQTLFAPLQNKQYFPRIYLSFIAALRWTFGYQIWVLRFLPSLSFVIGTLLWARLLARKSGSLLPLGILSGMLLLGSSLWLDQAIQLKQYSFDVMFALIPFVVSDELFRNALGDGRSKLKLAMLTVPVFLSYTYPLALGARIAGWYMHRGRRQGWRLSALGVCALVIPMTLGFVSIWLTDHRFNLRDHSAYLTYWNDCILRSRLHEGMVSVLGLTGDFIWGWHRGRLMPLVIAVVAPLQVLAVYRIIKHQKSPHPDSDEVGTGSRTLGSLVLLAGTILASLLVSYPICAGRLVLFTQVHTQILAIEGASFVLGFWTKRKSVLLVLYLSIAIVAFYSVHRYVRFIQEEPAENLRPMLPLIKPEVANTVWVHRCSEAQVESLPEALPVGKVLLNTRGNLPEPGQTIWVLWTNMSDTYCQEQLNEVRSHAVSWQIVHEGPGRGLALARF